MIRKTVKITVPYEKCGLPSEGCSPEMDIYSVTGRGARPAVLICPGGGYEYCSEREGEPVALRFASYGVNAFVLRYSCVMKMFPTALLEAAAAMAYIRNNAAGLGVDPDKVLVCGFSAGAHLAASLAVHWDKDVLTDALGGDKTLYRPDGAILGYPVVTAGEKRHDGSILNITGEDCSPELKRTVSLELHVTPETPPVFVWHTADDGCVPVENTLLFVKALSENGVPFACHIFEKGVHGLALCDRTTADYEGHINPDCAQWFPMAVDWIKARFGV